MCARNHEEVVGDGEGACWVALNDDGAGVLGRFAVSVRCSDDLSEGMKSALAFGSDPELKGVICRLLVEGIGIGAVLVNWSKALRSTAPPRIA